MATDAILKRRLADGTWEPIHPQTHATQVLDLSENVSLKLNNLTDVSVSSATEGQTLVFQVDENDVGTWVPGTPSGGGGGGSSGGLRFVSQVFSNTTAESLYNQIESFVSGNNDSNLEGCFFQVQTSSVVITGGADTTHGLFHTFSLGPITGVGEEGDDLFDTITLEKGDWIVANKTWTISGEDQFHWIIVNNNDASKVNKSGDTMTGALTFSGLDTQINFQEDHFVLRRFDTVIEAVTNASTAYILLCRNAGGNDVNGTITMDRTSGLRHASRVDILVSAGSSANPVGTVRSMATAGSAGTSYDLVTLTYNGNVHIALRIYNPDNYYDSSGMYFTGRIKTTDVENEFKMVGAADVSEVTVFSVNESHQIDGNTIYHTGNFTPATVATSGDYDDLTNKPSIPSISGLATETYVDNAVSGLVDSAPGTLNTLNELAAALGDDENFATTVTDSIADKVSKDGDTMSGQLSITSTGTIGDTSNLAEAGLLVDGSLGFDGNQIFFSGGAYINAGVDLALGAGGTGIQSDIYIKADHNVGIGTTNPGYKLDINSGTNYTHLRVGGAGAPLIKFAQDSYNSGNGAELWQQDGKFYLNIRSDLNAFAVDVDGNMGIGTSTPGYKLDVAGNVHGQQLYADDYIYHTGDTNTYIRFVAADDLQIVVGGRQMLRMDEGTDPDRLRFVNDSDWTDSSGNWNMSNSVSSPTFYGSIATSGDGQSNTPFRLASDYSSYMVAAAGNTWGLFWAGNVGAKYGTNGTGGPGNIWGNSGNPNEFVFAGNDSTKWTLYGNTGDTWQSGSLLVTGNAGIGTTSPNTKLDVRGGIQRTNTRVDNNERYPLGHYTPGETVFEIDPTWTQDELRAYFNSNNVSWSADSSAPGGYSIKIDSNPSFGGQYGSGFPYIPIDQDDEFYMEMWIRSEAGAVNAHYLGSNEYNQNFTSLGGNPGSFGYWVMSNTQITATWTKVSGYIGGFSNNIGDFESGTKYWTPMMLANYTNVSGPRVSYISGWKVIKVSHPGNRFFKGDIFTEGDLHTAGIEIGTSSYAQAIDSKSSYLLLQRDQTVPIEIWGSEIQSRTQHTFFSELYRSAHNSGYFVGSYNNVGENSTRTNPIYTIGSNYKPAASTLGNMYGIGYTYTSASFINFSGGAGWGMYVAADGDARVWLNGSAGTIASTGEHYVGSSKVWHAGNLTFALNNTTLTITY